MIKWRVILLILLIFQIIVMGCTAFKQHQDPGNIQNDRYRHRKAIYFYPKKENYRGMLNTRAIIPASSSRISYHHHHQNQFDRRSVSIQQGLNPQRFNSINQSYRKGHHQHALNSGIFVPKLPDHYTNLNDRHARVQNRRGNNRLKSSKHFPLRSLPIFEQDEEDRELIAFNPIIYNRGSKRNVNLNNAVNYRKFPMMESVPGEILYPPNVPNFKAIPLKSELISSTILRSPSNISSINTKRSNSKRMIPFYAHEAIIPWPEKLTTMTTSTTTTTIKPFYAHIPYEESRFLPISTSTPLPQIVYAVPFSKLSKDFTIPHKPHQEALEDRIHSLSSNPTKIYKAYRNKDDISLKPIYEEQFETLSTVSPRKTTESQKSYQISAPNYFHNHRIETTTPLTPMIINTFTMSSNVTHNPSTSGIWAEKSERSGKRILTSKQGGFRSCYPLNIYTLNKLMQQQKKQQEEKLRMSRYYYHPYLNETMNPAKEEQFFSDDNILESAGHLSDNSRTFPGEISNLTPKKTRQVNNVVLPRSDAISVEPNINWIVTNHRYDEDVDGPHKYSSHYKEMQLSPLSTKSIPKIHESSAILGTQILVQR